MGIKNLNTLIKRYAPDAKITVPYEHLAGKRIAIDGHRWMYAEMSVVRKMVVNQTDFKTSDVDTDRIQQEWCIRAVAFVNRLMQYGITPVFVLDGQHPPEKDQTKAKRRNTKIEARQKIDALYAELRNHNWSVIPELKKQLRNCTYIRPDDIQILIDCLTKIGAPILMAVGDGEKLCSSLCIEGKVSAVYSSDTDCFPLGCPLLITKFESDGAISVRLDRFLQGLNLSMTQFVDLCIMCGCDFNTNIPGYAAIKSYGLIQKYTSIAYLPPQLDVSCLNYIRCQDIFKYQPSDDLTLGSTNLDMSPWSKTDFKFDLSSWMDITQSNYQRLTPVDGHVEQLQLEIIRPYVPPIVLTYQPVLS